MTIEVTGLSLYTHHGVSAAEREVGQRLVLDLRMEVGECDATVTDLVEDTVDYARGLRARGARRPAALATRRSSACARPSPTACSADFAAEEVWVKATKPEPPIPLPVESVSVEVWRQSGDGTTMSAFARATAVEPLGGGAWRADVRRRRGTTPARAPTAATSRRIVLRAMAAELDDPARAARSLTCHYLRPPGAGEVRVDVTVERSGRSLTHRDRARLSQGGTLCVLAVAAFAVDFRRRARLRGRCARRAARPTPSSALHPSRMRRRSPQHFEMRPTLGRAALRGRPRSVTGGWLRFADGPSRSTRPRWRCSPTPGGRRRCRASRGPSSAPTIDLTVHFRAPAAAAAIAEEPVLAVFRSSTAADGFFEEDGELWSATASLLAHSRQLALLVDGDAMTIDDVLPDVGLAQRARRARGRLAASARPPRCASSAAATCR